MSRVGKKPVELPDGVKFVQESGLLKVEGPKGKLEQHIPAGVSIKVDGKTAVVVEPKLNRVNRGYQGMVRSLLANMVEGVSKGYEKNLEISGVGYRADLKGKELVLMLGYSHPVVIAIPDGITVKVDKQTKVSVAGADRQMVGQIAALVRHAKDPDPYKAKGVKYVDEQIIRKVGKTSAK